MNLQIFSLKTSIYKLYMHIFFLKISRGYVELDGLGDTLVFYPNKIGQKLAEVWGVQCNSHKIWFLS